MRPEAPIFSPARTLPLAPANELPDPAVPHLHGLATDDIITALIDLPRPTRQRTLGAMLDTLSAEEEASLGSAIKASEHALRLHEVSEEIAARQHALSASPATQGELIHALGERFPHRSHSDLALASLLLPPAVSARILQSHASFARRPDGANSSRAMHQALARLCYPLAGMSTPAALMVEIELILAEIPGLDYAHPEASEFLRRQSERLIREEARLSGPVTAPDIDSLLPDAAGDAALRALDEALSALCRAQSIRLEGTRARALLDQTSSIIGHHLIAQANLRNHCAALGLSQPDRLPGELIAACVETGRQRTTVLRKLVSGFSDSEHETLKQRFLDRQGKPKAALKNHLCSLRESGLASEVALADVIDRFTQLLRSPPAAGTRAKHESDDEFLAAALAEVRRRKGPGARAPAAPESLATQHTGQIRQPKKAGTAGAGAKRSTGRLIESTRSQAPAGRQARDYGLALTEMLEAIDQGGPSSALLEKYIAALPARKIARLLSDGECFMLARAEGTLPSLFPARVIAQSQWVTTMFSFTHALATRSQPALSIAEVREWLAESFANEPARMTPPAEEDAAPQDLIDTLLVCVPRGALWARAIEKASASNASQPDEQHIDWITGLEAYRTLERQMTAVPELGEDIFLTWLDINRRYLTRAGTQGSAYLTPDNARVLEEIATQQGKRLGVMLGNLVEKIGSFEINRSMTYAMTMSRVKSRSESMASLGTFSAWVLLDALLHSKPPAAGSLPLRGARQSATT